MSDFNDFLRIVHQFENNHHKELLKDKQKIVFNLYNGLLGELKGLKTINAEIKSQKYDITILITSDESLYVSEYDYFLDKLIVFADVRNIKIVKRKIVLDLWYRCWEYQELRNM